MTDIPQRAYAGDHAAAWELENDIVRRRLQDAYVRALIVSVIPEAARWDITHDQEPGGYIDRAALFVLIRATPEQRARAYERTVG